MGQCGCCARPLRGRALSRLCHTGKRSTRWRRKPEGIRNDIGCAKCMVRNSGPYEESSMNPRYDLASCVLTMILAGLVWLGVGGERLASAHDRPSGPVHKTRSAVMARQGMAATSQPLATATAIRVLQQGGNAVDAAIAANAVLGVVEPMSCGLGGDLFAIVWDSKTKKLVGLNASGRSPAAATIDLFKSKGLSAIPTFGPLSLVGPGLRRRVGSAPQAVRHQDLARAAGAGDRLR